MSTALIIGSGPAAAGAALALTADPVQQVTVVDVGATLEADLDTSVGRLAATSEDAWSPADVALIGRQPVHAGRGVLPEKRAYGSDFPFRDVGQLDGIAALGDANPSVVSGAYGGFSNVWGAQVMPFSEATFDLWPVSLGEMQPHYRIAMDEMTLAGDDDDLAELFPLFDQVRPLPPPADRTARVLDRYRARRALVRSHGVTLGRARLAFRAEGCTRCGLCMTGCPYGLIYSSAHTFDRLRAEKRIAYRSGLLAVHLEEVGGEPRALVRHVGTGRVEQLAADRIFVACGGIGTTRLVLGSLGRFDRAVHLQESVQFVVPAVSRSPVRDPRRTQDFTLNQFNLLYDATGQGVDLCQVHFYEYNPAFLASLPAPLRHPKAGPLTGGLLRRISVGLGYVPGWAAPSVEVVARRAGEGKERLPALEIGREGSDRWPPMLRDLVWAMLRVAPALDLWPVVPMISLSAAAKSYHFGASFPHDRARTATTTDRRGRLAAWDNIHLVDASVFPVVPATTFTLTIMANAHRIVSETLGAPR
ncbi:MAG TPA: GMC oxidoreductase [Acidimicrobiales bacterium]|nr:GMC oxidoreductase [Acidimicrobiales bacterium]